MPFFLGVLYLESIEFLFLKNENPEMLDLFVSEVQIEAKSEVRSHANEDFLVVVVDEEDEKIDDNLDLKDLLLDSVDANDFVLCKSEFDLMCLGVALTEEAIVLVACFSLERFVTGTNEFNKS